MDTVEKVSDRIILIGGGKILADGTFEELKNQEGDTLEQLFSQLTGETDYSNLADDFLNTFKD
jgi:ABC-2 type transport system ATP-binding protein